MITRSVTRLAMIAGMAALAACANTPPPAAPFATSVAPRTTRAPGTTNGSVTPSLGSGYNPETGTTAGGGGSE